MTVTREQSQASTAAMTPAGRATMKAAVFRGPSQPLDVTDVPVPSPAAGEVLVRVAGCGLCHTDLHYLDHGVKTFKPPPIVLGHEAAGTIAQVGEGVEHLSEGARVLIPAVLSCGHCRYCRRGRERPRTRADDTAR